MGTTRDVAQAVVSAFTGATPERPGSFTLAGRTYELLPLVGGKVPPAAKRSMRRFADATLDAREPLLGRMVSVILDSVDKRERARLRRDIGAADVSEAQQIAQQVIGRYAAAVRAAGGTPEDAL